MVERSACVTDARGAEAALTTKGLDTLRTASRTHLDGVQRYFLGIIGDAERASIETGCNLVLDELGRDADSESSCSIPKA